MFEIILRPYLKAIVADQMSDGETCLPYCLVPRGRDGERMEGKSHVVGDGWTEVRRRSCFYVVRRPLGEIFSSFFSHFGSRSPWRHPLLPCKMCLCYRHAPSA